MNAFLLFIVTFAISALGSAPPGLINMMVLERSISRGKKAGVMTAMGTFIPEFVYTFLAAYAYTAINNNVELGQNLKLAGGLVLVVLGGFYFFRRPEEPKLDYPTSKRDSYRGFRKGFFTASINMLIIPFWAFIAGYLGSQGYAVTELPDLIAFSLGSALGALVMFLLYVRLGHFVLKRISKVARYSNKFLAVLFLSLGLYQLLRLY